MFAYGMGLKLARLLVLPSISLCSIFFHVFLVVRANFGSKLFQVPRERNSLDHLEQKLLTAMCNIQEMAAIFLSNW